MGTNRRQRQEIEDMENLAAILDRVDDTLRLLALHLRAPWLLAEIADARRALAHGQAIVWRRRDELHRDAGG